jgi:hypothetical protein
MRAQFVRAPIPSKGLQQVLVDVAIACTLGFAAIGRAGDSPHLLHIADAFLGHRRNPRRALSPASTVSRQGNTDYEAPTSHP